MPDIDVKRIKDREKYLFNPLTGQFDLALEFNTSRIVTAQRNSAGELSQEYDYFTDTYTDNSFDIVTDRHGNVLSGNYIDNTDLEESEVFE